MVVLPDLSRGEVSCRRVVKKGARGIFLTKLVLKGSPQGVLAVLSILIITRTVAQTLALL